MKKNWLIRQPDPETVKLLKDNLDINKIISELLVSRGIKKESEAVDFLFPNLSLLSSPFLMENMDKAVKRIKDAVKENQKIGIFTDSDLDGMTSLVLADFVFKRFKVDYAIKYPTGNQGYGLSKEVIDYFINENVNLLITLDCGISDKDEICYAVQNNIDVIVCDHHEEQNEKPDAIIINPKQRSCSFPFENLAGVGVTFYLFHAVLYSYLPIYDERCCLVVYNHNKYFYKIFKNGIQINNQLESVESIDSILEKVKPISLIVSHQVSKDDEIKIKSKNFKFLSIKKLLMHYKLNSDFNGKLFLNQFNIPASKSKNEIEIVTKIFHLLSMYYPPKIKKFFNDVLPFVAIGTAADVMPFVDKNRILLHFGLKAFNESELTILKRLKGYVNREIDIESISWSISPLLNSPGRFGKINLTADFLLANDQDYEELFEQIILLNNKRKDILEDFYNKCLSDIESKNLNNLILVKSENIPEGFTGLLANKIAGKYHLPVIVMTLTEDNIYKGSGRVSYNFDFFKIIERLSHMFEKFGGHRQAFGFSISSDNVDFFIKNINEKFWDISSKQEIINIDMEIRFSDITMQLIHDLNLLAPYGHKNEPPLFLLKELPVKKFSYFGKDNNHGKYEFNNSIIQAIGWQKGDEMNTAFQNEKIDIVCTIETNLFLNKEYIRLIIEDIDGY